jgi:hypothetical protein
MTQTHDALAKLAAAVAMMGVAGVVRGQTDQTYFVDARAPAGGDGRTWTTAYRDLQDVLESVVDGHLTVYLAGGTYRPDRGTHQSGSRFATMTSAVSLDLRGSCAGIGGIDPFAVSVDEHPTIFSGDLLGDDEGWANRSDNAEELIDFRGVPGMVHRMSGVVIEDAGQATFPFGMYTFKSACDLVLNNCRIQGNAAWMGVLQAEHLTLEHCSVENNFAGYSTVISGPLDMHRCTFSGNHSDTQYALLEVYGEVYADSCSIAVGPEQVFRLFAPSKTFVNCSLRGPGTVLTTWNSSLTLINCTVFGGDDAHPAVRVYYVSPRLTNTIVWSRPEHAIESLVPIIATRSIVRGGVGIPGVIGADPRFVAAEIGDLQLRAGSPGIDAASNADYLAYSTEPFDVSGQPRFRDDTGTPDTGLGLAPIVDIGAYEFQGTTCYADCDASGALNVLDFNCFLNSFGAGSPRANCDNSSTPPVLNVLDFTCFINRFTAGCP